MCLYAIIFVARAIYEGNGQEVHDSLQKLATLQKMNPPYEQYPLLISITWWSNKHFIKALLSVTSRPNLFQQYLTL